MGFVYVESSESIIAMAISSKRPPHATFLIVPITAIKVSNVQIIGKFGKIDYKKSFYFKFSCPDNSYFLL